MSESPTERPRIQSGDSALVGIVDGNEVRSELYSYWLRQIHCRAVSSPDELLDGGSRTYLVVCFSSESDLTPVVANAIRRQHPHVQILLLLPRSASFITINRSCDETLSEPVDRTAFRETVRRLFRRGLFNLKLHQFYQLNTRLVAFEKSSRAGERTRDTSSLEETIRRLREEISSLAAQMDEPDFDALLQTVRVRNQYFSGAESDRPPKHASKYHPDSCLNCGLEWGSSHGDRLGLGYRRIAAFVWECTRCNDILKLSAGEYDKIL